MPRPGHACGRLGSTSPVRRDRLTYRGGNGGWGGRIRTSVWRSQSPLPYRLATPQADGKVGCGGGRGATPTPQRRRSVPADHPPVGTGGSDAPPRPPQRRRRRRTGRSRSGRCRTCGRAGSPGRRESAASSSPITGSSERAGASRSLRLRRSQSRPGCAGAGSARRPNSSGRTAANTSAVASGWRGIDQDEIEAGQAGQRLEQLADAAHPGGPAAQADEDVAAQRQGRPRPGPALPAAGARAGRSPRKVAAASAEPPPMPDGDRQPLVEPDRGRSG